MTARAYQHPSSYSFLQLLKNIEWQSDYSEAGPWCPSCGGRKEHGHVDNCELAFHIAYCESVALDRPGESKPPIGFAETSAKPGEEIVIRTGPKKENE